MAAIDFPSSPSNGDTHVVGGVTYTYNSAETKWKTTINSNAFLPLTGGTVSGNILMGGEIQHDGDTDTNISFDTDTILFDTAGSERFRVGSAGQLGIGGATYGSSGQVLTSGGASAAPSWGSAGKILQVQSHSISTRSTEAISANSDGSTKWLTVNITPSSTSSQIVIWYVLNGAMDYDYWGTILRRGTTPISVGTSTGQRAATTTFFQSSNDTNIRIDSHSGCFVDSPGVDTQLDYNVIVHNSNNASQTFYANSTVNNTDTATLRNRVASNIIVAEYLP